MTDKLTIAGRQFSSRLMIGTGKFAGTQVMAAAVDASGAQIVTVALRRVDLDAPGEDMLAALDPKRYLILPNTSGARDAQEAIRLARLARAGGLEPWVKLEVTPDPRTLLPDPVETLRAAVQLVKEGFTVLPYMPADPILARHLEEAGVAALMPLGSPIGTGNGLRTRDFVEIIRDQASVPVVVDAGLGLPSHAAQAMELGVDAVLLNTAVAIAADPVRIARAFRLAVEAGREAYLSGPGLKTHTPQASSPQTGYLE